MLNNNFYFLKKIERKDDRITGSLLLNSAHAIFKGHFPNIPIVPGVVLIQIVKELIGNELNIRLKMFEAKNIKFLDYINPFEIEELQFEFFIKENEDATLKVQATISSENRTHFKSSAQYKIIDN